MSTPPPEPPPENSDPNAGSDFGYVPVSPLLDEDPPKIGEFWLDARIGATPAGVTFVGHDALDRSAMIILLSEGAAADPAARDRLAGMVNRMHIDTVLARGGQGQDSGRLGRKFVADDDDPVAPDAKLLAPWVALAYDGTPAAAAESKRVLDEVELAGLDPQGAPSGPDYNHYWIDRVRPGLARLWPLPWPGRYDRAGWRTILVSWLLMLLIGALAVLIAILVFRNQPPQAPPPPTGGSGSPPPASSSPQSGSPQSGSPQSGSPQSASPQSGSPQSGSPSGSQSGSPQSPSGSQTGSPSQSPSGSGSGSPSPSGTESGGGEPTPSTSGEPGNSSPGSRL